MFLKWGVQICTDGGAKNVPKTAVSDTSTITNTLQNKPALEGINQRTMYLQRRMLEEAKLQRKYCDHDAERAMHNEKRLPHAVLEQTYIQKLTNRPHGFSMSVFLMCYKFTYFSSAFQVLC